MIVGEQYSVLHQLLKKQRFSTENDLFHDIKCGEICHTAKGIATMIDVGF